MLNIVDVVRNNNDDDDDDDDDDQELEKYFNHN